MSITWGPGSNPVTEIAHVKITDIKMRDVLTTSLVVLFIVTGPDVRLPWVHEKITHRSVLEITPAERAYLESGVHLKKLGPHHHPRLRRVNGQLILIPEGDK